MLHPSVYPFVHWARFPPTDVQFQVFQNLWLASREPVKCRLVVEIMELGYTCAAGLPKPDYVLCARVAFLATGRTRKVNPFDLFRQASSGSYSPMQPAASMPEHFPVIVCVVVGRCRVYISRAYHALLGRDKLTSMAKLIPPVT